MAASLFHVSVRDVFPMDVLQEGAFRKGKKSKEVDSDWEDFHALTPEVEVLIGADGLTDCQREVVALYLSGESVEDLARKYEVEPCDIDLCLRCAFDVMREKEESAALLFRSAAA